MHNPRVIRIDNRPIHECNISQYHIICFYPSFCLLFAVPTIFKITQNVFGFPPSKVCRNQFDVFLLCQFLVLPACICPVRNYDYRFPVYSFRFQCFLQKLTVTVYILLILIVKHNASIFTGCLCYICHISTILFPRFSRYVASGSAGFCIIMMDGLRQFFPCFQIFFCQIGYTDIKQHLTSK